MEAPEDANRFDGREGQLRGNVVGDAGEPENMDLQAFAPASNRLRCERVKSCNPRTRVLRAAVCWITSWCVFSCARIAARMKSERLE